MIQPATGMFFGTAVFVNPDRAAYVLPDEVIPGVPWPPGFKEEINTWALGFFSTWNLLRDGEVVSTPAGLYMNPRTYASVQRAVNERTCKEY